MTTINTITSVFKSMSIFIAAIAIIGNALVSHIIVRLKTMKTSINYIILNLAILDTISGISTIYYVLSNDHQGVLVKPILERAHNQSSVLAEVMCRIQLCHWLPVSFSPLLLLIMAYERYKGIVHPLSRLDGTVTKARLKWMLPLAWITGLPYLLTDMVYVRYDKVHHYCDYKWLNFEIFLTLWIITQYLIPSTAMVIFYARIIYALRRQNNELGPQAEVERIRRKARRKVVRIIVAVTLVFYLFCGIPQAIYVLATLISEQIDAYLLEDIITVFLVGNFAFNPCAYFLFMQSFRDGFRRLFMSQRENITRPNVLAIFSGSRRSVSTQDIKESANGKRGNEPQLLSFHGSQNDGDKH